MKIVFFHRELKEQELQKKSQAEGNSKQSADHFKSLKVLLFFYIVIILPHTDRLILVRYAFPGRHNSSLKVDAGR